jgi:hypothetical protein
MDEQTGQWIIVFGDPILGFTYYGPFANGNQASRVAERWWPGAYSHYWIVPLTALDDTENEQLLDELTKEAQANGEYEPKPRPLENPPTLRGDKTLSDLVLEG